jgi:hypothetical protein
MMKGSLKSYRLLDRETGVLLTQGTFLKPKTSLLSNRGRERHDSLDSAERRFPRRKLMIGIHSIAFHCATRSSSWFTHNGRHYRPVTDRCSSTCLPLNKNTELGSRFFVFGKEMKYK